MKHPRKKGGLREKQNHKNQAINLRKSKRKRRVKFLTSVEVDAVSSALAVGSLKKENSEKNSYFKKIVVNNCKLIDIYFYDRPED